MDKQLPPLPESRHPPQYFWREPAYTADQMNAHYLKGYKDGQKDAREWKSIETAPKQRLPNGDPDVILLALPPIGALRDGSRRVFEGCWHSEQETWTSVNGFLLLSAATHWQRIPMPPVSGKD